MGLLKYIKNEIIFKNQGKNNKIFAIKDGKKYKVGIGFANIKIKGSNNCININCNLPLSLTLQWESWMYRRSAVTRTSQWTVT